MENPQPPKAFPVSWDQFHRDCRALAWRLNGEKCDVTAYDIASIAAFEKPEGMDDLAFADLFISFDKRGLRYVPGDTPAEDRWSYYDQQTYQYLEIDLRQDAKFLAARAAYDFIVDARQRPAAARCDGL